MSKAPHPTSTYRIGTFLYLPNRDIIGFHFSFHHKALDKPGILVSLLSIFSIRDISIVGFDISQVTPKTPIEGFIYIDITGRKDINPKEIINEMKSKPYIIDIKLIKPLFNGLICDPYFFPLNVFNERAIIFLKRNYEGMIKEIRKQLGSAAKTLLYLMGHNIGTNYYEKGGRIIVGKDLEKLIKLAIESSKQVGLGIIEIEEIKPEKLEATIKIYQSSECELFKGSNKCESHFIRGIIAGWISQLFKSKTEVIEEKCIAKGDPYCQFKIKFISKEKERIKEMLKTISRILS